MAIYGGTYMDDLLIGGPDADVLWGGMGDDELSGGAGNDRLIGGPGGDALNGGSGMDIASYTTSPTGVQVDLRTFSPGDEETKPVIRDGDAEGDTLAGIESLWGSAFGDILLGSHGGNHLFGNAGDDIIMGRAGNDVLRGGDDNDELGHGDGVGEAEEGDDILYGDGGVDLLKGGPGTDRLFGGEDDDELQGGDQNDWLEGGMGADVIDGGLHERNALAIGGDTAAYSMSEMPVTIDLTNVNADGSVRDPRDGPYASGGDAAGDTFLGIENLRGSAGDDVLMGDHLLNMIWGNAGDDTIMGRGKTAEQDGDTTDYLFGGKGNDTISGGEGNDAINGQMGDDELRGDEGGDSLTGGPGADKLYGGVVDEDGVHADANGFESYGAPKGDTASYSRSDAGVTIDLNVDDPEDPVEAEGGDAEGDELYGIENITGSVHTDKLTGDGERNVLNGGKGDDWDDPDTRDVEGGVFGEGGDDLLLGGDGMDKLDGGGGMDDLWGGNGDDVIAGGKGDDRPFFIDGPGDGDNVPEVSVTDDTDSEDTNEARTGLDKVSLSEPTPAKALEALYGMDIMRAGLFGGSGNDTLMGGEGSDYHDGGAGVDTVDFSYSGAVVTRQDNGVVVNLGEALAAADGVNLNDDAAGVADVIATGGHDASDDGTVLDTTTTHAADDIYIAIENAIGSDANDVLVGSDRPNELDGGRGRDFLYGGSGNDTLIAGRDGGIGSAAATILADANSTAAERQAALVADAAASRQILIGGSGADTFVFTEGAHDKITDFNRRQGDRLDLRDLDLSENDLDDILAAVNEFGTGGSLAGSVFLDFTEYGGGSIEVEQNNRPLSLDVDDFMI